MLPGAIDHTLAVDDVMKFIAGSGVILLLSITIVMIYFVFRFNRKRNPRSKNIEGNFVVETLFLTLPTLLALAMFYYGYEGFAEMRSIPKDAYPIKVIGRQWSWTFEYPNGKRSDTVYVPLGRPIKFLVTSVDVIHSFYIPAFREKQDAVPGSVFYMMLYPEHLGSYDVACAEYCGLHHALMYTKLNVVTQDAFDKWLKRGIANQVAVDSLNNKNNQ